MTTGQLLFGQDFEAVIFDFDGTLVDSHEAMLSAYGTWAEEFGISLELLPQFLGMPNTALAEQVLPPELVPTAVARIEQLEVQSPEGVVPLPGALKALRLLGSAAGIATSCTMPLLVARSEAARLKLPEVVVTRDQVENGKPAPDTFLAAAERLGVRPERALVVEDAPAGVAAARAAGCAVLGILSTLDAATLGADVSVKDLSHISWRLSDGTISLW